MQLFKLWGFIGLCRSRSRSLRQPVLWPSPSHKKRQLPSSTRLTPSFFQPCTIISYLKNGTSDGGPALSAKWILLAESGYFLCKIFAKIPNTLPRRSSGENCGRRDSNLIWAQSFWRSVALFAFYTSPIFISEAIAPNYSLLALAKKSVCCLFPNVNLF